MRKQDFLTLLLAVMCGFIGGAVSVRIQAAMAESPKVFQASRFELTDDSGKRIGVWGRDSQNQVVFSFLGNDGKPVAAFGLARNGSPFLDMMGKDGKTRVTLRLGRAGRPLLGMGDEGWEGRALLGFIERDTDSGQDGDWGLLFRTPSSTPDLASIGVLTTPKDGTQVGALTLRSSTGKTWSFPPR